MFTGIVTDIGEVRSIEHRDDIRLVISTRYDTAGIALGASIACSGACLTVVDLGADWFAVDVSRETTAATVIAAWEAGTRVNLERALKLGDELGGHMVSGHVDGVAVIRSIEADGGSRRLRVAPPEALACYIAPKGSVTLDGVSLTVNELAGNEFGINLIPHTWERTTFSDRTPGDRLNMEVDVLARYVARLQSVKGA